MEGTHRACFPSSSSTKRSAGWLSVFAMFGLAALLNSTTTAVLAQPANTLDTAQPPRHGDWRMSPQPLLPTPNDPQQTELLNLRGAYFDKIPGAMGISKDVPRVPLDQPQPAREGGSSRSQAFQDELPFFRSARRAREAIIVATFESYQTYLTPSHLSIYTDVKMSVEQVLEAGDSAVTPGQTIDVLFDGGTIQLSDGRTLSAHLYSELLEYSLQPHHRYLLFLDYEANGHFFTDYKDWELSKGIALPNRADEEKRFREGQARYSGLSEDKFIAAVRKAITENKGEN